MMLNRKYRAMTVAILFLVAAGIAVTAGISSRSLSTSGSDLDRAGAAALAATGSGRVTESEISDEKDGYEVEVTLDNGHKLEVRLDANFKVIGKEADNEADDDADDADDADDDDNNAKTGDGADID